MKQRRSLKFFEGGFSIFVWKNLWGQIEEFFGEVGNKSPKPPGYMPDKKTMLFKLGVVCKLRHGKNEFFDPPPPCHKFSKKEKFCVWTVTNFSGPPSPQKRDVICGRPLIQKNKCILFNTLS